MFGVICTFAALILAAFAHPKYRFIALLVAFEFVAHKITYNYLFLDLRSENSGLIYVLYASIQVMILLFMYMRQTHFTIALLVFLNLVYNFLTTLQHQHLTTVNFHDPYWVVIGVIMILELLYLLGANLYVANYLKRNGFVDLDAIDSAILVWRRPSNRDLVQGNEI